MALIGTLNSAVAGNVISASEYNQNFAAVRAAFNDSAVLMDVARTIVAQHTFQPATAQAPFVLGANAQNQLVTGLYAALAANAENLGGQLPAYYLDAEKLGGQLPAYYLDAANLTGTIPAARITEVSTITTGVWQGTAIANAYVANLPTSKITSGTFDNARISSGAVTQHEAALSIASTQLTGAISSAQLSGNYTGITRVGDLTQLSVGGGVTITGIYTEVRLIDYGTLGPGEANVTISMIVTGATVGDHVLVFVDGDGSGMNEERYLEVHGWVSSANVVKVVAMNMSDDTHVFTNTYVRVMVFKN